MTSKIKTMMAMVDMDMVDMDIKDKDDDGRDACSPSKGRSSAAGG